MLHDTKTFPVPAVSYRSQISRFYALLKKCKKNIKQEIKSKHILSELEDIVDNHLTKEVYRLRVLIVKIQHALHISSRYEESIILCSRALSLNQKVGDIRLGIEVKSLSGICHYYIGNYELTLSLFFEILTDYQKLRKPNKNDQRTLAITYYYLSILFVEDTDQKKSIRYLNRAKSIYKKTGCKEGIAKCYNQLATIYSLAQEHKKALTMYNRFLQMSGENSDRSAAAIALNNIGTCWAFLGEYQKAKTFINYALTLKKKTPNKRSYIVSLISLAEVHVLEKNYDEAVSVLESIKKQAIKLGLKAEQRSITQLLYEVYENIGNYQLALENHKLLYALNQELLNIEREKYVVEANVKFEAERQKRESLFYKRRIRQANIYTKRLEASNRELKLFAHLAAHDMKEPLRTISLNMELLERIVAHKLEDDELQLFSCVSKASRHMFDIVDDILTLISVDRNRLDMEAVDTNAIVKNIIQEKQKEINEKNISIKYDALPVVPADSSQMYLLLKNLIGNAIKYSHQTDPSICVSCSTLTDKFRFVVQDNGIGIPRKYHHKIFELFNRGSNAHSQYDGTGIGLSLCKRIVERHQGTIQVTSKPNEGAVFVFCIPRQKSETLLSGSN